MERGPSDPIPSARPDLEELSRSLADRQELRPGPPAELPALAALGGVATFVEKLRSHLATEERTGLPAKAVEWFLDNDHHVLRAIRQVRKDMPRGFYERLPGLASGQPRVHALARAYLEKMDLEPDAESLGGFVTAFQDVTTLRMAELWALPPMLRLVGLENLVEALARLLPDRPPPFPIRPAPPGLPPPDDAEIIARCVRIFRMVDEVRWGEFFAATSLVEAILRQDPAGVFARMDFETRDRYRATVEEIAWRTKISETEVARRAVESAGKESSPAGGRNHIGYYLRGPGLRAFQESFGYVPPWSWRFRRGLTRRPSWTYFGGLAGTTLLAWSVPLVYLAAHGGMSAATILAAGLALMACFALATTLVNWVLTLVLHPRVLPKMRFESGIPEEFHTVVAVPTLLGSPAEVRSIVRQLEMHYLANPQPGLEFAILGDFLDASEEVLESDGEILRLAEAQIRSMNEKHGGARQPFHLLLRKRLWNPGENCWMGWERKRGKLEEFNRFLGGDDDTTFTIHVGDSRALRRARFVITLDSDTLLPHGMACRLAGTLAHPLNRPEFDAATGRILRGYSVIQPRVEVAPASGGRSAFTRLFAGDAGVDIYTRAVSNVYQDLFGEGVYVGKGIYDVEAFRRSTEDRVPENSLLSHDLFEGIHGRVALAADLVLYEEYPPGYLAYARRLHRWVRGDWQLLPWLGPRVPSRGGKRLPNRLRAIDRWKILDNLRRSLLAPGLLLLLVAGWSFLPGSAWAWTLLALLAPAGQIFTGVATALLGRRRLTVPAALVARLGRGVRENAGRWLLFWVFAPHESLVTADAILRTLVRLTVTRRRLLEWRSAAHTARALGSNGVRLEWREMSAGPVLAVLAGAWMIAARPGVYPWVLPALVLWALSPGIARLVSRPIVPRPEPPDEAGIRELREIARRTWSFMETFVGPEEQWLPPDNFQEDPGGEVAHRTSPTNIGMMFLSTMAAHDLGYLGLADLAYRLRESFRTLSRLERYRGHLFNWYDTTTLEVLEPRFVSTVDSGNLAACLLTLSSGCLEAASGAVAPRAQWVGLGDARSLVTEVVEGIAKESGSGAAWKRVISRIKDLSRRFRDVGSDRSQEIEFLFDLREHEWPRLEKEILRAIEESERPVGLGRLRELRMWNEHSRRQLDRMCREIELLAPWAPLRMSLPRLLEEAGVETPLGAAWQRLRPRLERTPDLDEIPRFCRRSRELAKELRSAIGEAAPGSGRDEALAWINELLRACDDGESNSVWIRRELLDLAARAEAEALGMDFRLLYDRRRDLFHIGYRTDLGRHDPNHYDLLASEARLAGFVAIAKGDVPEKHWFHLGRHAAKISGSLGLLSWGGTMFEYLMPSLLMSSGEKTFLAQSCRAAVDHQISYGREKGVPWGNSESGFHLLDPDLNYQYRAFGTPGLGFKLGLADDLVVAPYASMLALSLRPRAVVANLRRLADLGAVGSFGLYESLDFTPERLPRGKRFAIVRSYMAHHQGMIFASLDNFLTGGALVRRFHSHPIVRAAELLLHEQIPQDFSPEPIPGVVSKAPAPAAPARTAMTPWSPVLTGAIPEAHVLSNGSLSALFTDSGGGTLRWKGRSLTRWSADPTRETDGSWIYVRDEDGGALWSVGRNPTGVPADESHVYFLPHVVEIYRRDHGVLVEMEATVAPGDDVEIRRISVANETPRPRELTFTTYAEVSLAEAGDDQRHPAFEKLFLRTEALADGTGILVERRPRSPEDKPVALVHRVVDLGSGVRCVGRETDRVRFLGRGGSVRAPASLAPDRKILTGTDGHVLDPIVALQVRVTLPAHGRASFAFVTLVEGSRSGALRLAERFASADSIRWAVHDAALECGRELQDVGIPPEKLPDVQRLLSVLLFPNPSLRRTPGLSSEQLAEKSRLWGLGISGDHPILLLRLRGTEETELLEELLRAHHLWRRRGVAVDLVILREDVSGYDDDTSGRFARAFAATGAQVWMHRPGGIFVLRADQLPPGERACLEASAGAVLDGNHAALGRQIAAVGRPPHHLPRFVPPVPADRVREPTPILPRPADLVQDNGFGGFTPDGREYVIRLEPGRPTPAPWCNVIANPDFGCLVSESGLGCTWARNAGEFRLTPWRNDPVRDEPSEAVYLRDEETGQVWSPTPLPAPGGTPYEVRHGAGYTDFLHHGHGLVHHLRVFVGPEDPVKVVRLRLRNAWRRPRRITVTYYAEWTLGVTREQTQAHIVPDVDEEDGILFARCDWDSEHRGRIALLASTRPVHGFTTDRGEFLGRDGDLVRPAALDRWGLEGTVRPGQDPCAALQIHLELAPGEEAKAEFLLGEAGDPEAARRLVREYREPGRIEAAERSGDEYWDRILGAVEVQTPERSMNLLLNRWLLYQALSSRFFGRTAAYQSSGAFGFRDQLQDAMAMVHSRPDLVRGHILEAAARQFTEGDVLHWWHPPSGKGVRTRCSDDLLWLPWVTAHYVRATGDSAVLDEKVPFLTGDPLGEREGDRYGQFPATEETWTLFEHCRRALERGWSAGEHGLPLIGDGDWNDGMNRVGREGRGESVWLGWFLGATSLAFADLCRERGDEDEAERWANRVDGLRKSIEREAWDGGWYRRAFYDDGTPLGSAESADARIDSIAQSWAAISGLGDKHRVRVALRSVDEHLVRRGDRLVLLLTPPFEHGRRDPGYIKAYPPGIRENGGQYTHAATWVGWAWAMIGDGDRAEEIFRLLNPILRTRGSEDVGRYRVEPYVLAGDVYGAEPHVGRGGWTWYTGAAAWTWRLGVEAILGLRRVGGDLVVDPCIPARWSGFEATVRTEKCTCEIRVENPDGVSRGVAERILDGKPLEGERIPLGRLEGRHQIVVRLGGVPAPVHG